MTSKIQFYWREHYSSYADAKDSGGLRTVTHDYLDECTSLSSGIAADIRDLVGIGADMINHKAKIAFFLFDHKGALLDAWMGSA